MTGVLYNLVYLILIAACSPALFYQRWMYGKYREGWGQKFLGRLPVRNNFQGPRIWLHAVSVGEVLQLQQLIRKLREQSQSELDIFVSTTTQTGFQVASEKLKHCEVAYFPLDFTWSVKEAFQRVQPDLVVLVELEIWPNFLNHASRENVPVLLINGRLSEKSFRGYSKIRFLIAGLLNQVCHIAVQSNEYKDRFLALGGHPERISTTGSIKFDGVETNRKRPEVDALRNFFHLKENEFLFIAGSTQAPEEEMVLDTFEKLLRVHSQSRLIIVPRHPERGDAIARLIEERGYPLIRRSQPTDKPVDQNGKPSIGLLDTVGELSHCWALADIAFVGGSFGTRGGQNMLEPAAYGVPVCCGPNTRNFRQIVELLKAERAIQIAQDQSELDAFVLDSFSDSESATAMGERARTLVFAHQGATQSTVELILNHLGEQTQLTRAA